MRERAVIFLSTLLVIGFSFAKKEMAAIRAAMFKSPATEATVKYITKAEQQTGIELVFDVYPYVVLREEIMT